MKKLNKKINKKNIKNDNIKVNENINDNVEEKTENEIIDFKIENENKVETEILENEILESEIESEKVEDEKEVNVEDENLEPKPSEISSKLEELKKPVIKKTSLIYELLSRPQGAKIEELMDATGWQKHSVRGTLTNLQKDLQFQLLKLETSKPNFDEKGFIKETTYFIKDAECHLEINCKVFEIES